MAPPIPVVPLKIRKEIRSLGCRRTAWDLYDDEKWFGYTIFGGQRVAITVALVTGKACIEILAPIAEHEVLI
jgi:hypothetical protein